MNLTAQIQSILDSVGIRLDAESFANLLKLLRIDRLSWFQKLSLAVGVGVLVEILKKRAQDNAARKAAEANATGTR